MEATTVPTGLMEQGRKIVPTRHGIKKGGTGEEKRGRLLFVLSLTW